MTIRHRAALRRHSAATDNAAAVQDAESRRFLREYEAFFTELREQDPGAWAELEQERGVWDMTLMDGLEDE